MPVVVPLMLPTLKVPLVWKLNIPLGFNVTGPERVKVVPPFVAALICMVPVRTPPVGPVTVAKLVAEKVPELLEEKLPGDAVATMAKLAVKADG